MTKKTTLTVAMACGLAGASAQAQDGTMTFSWQTLDTGDGDGVIEPGESLFARLWVEWDVPVTGFAAATFDIFGDSVYQAGTVYRHDERLNVLGSDGTLDDDNTIRNAFPMQLPPLFSWFESGNPLLIYIFEWTPASYAPTETTISLFIRRDARVYIDDFGSSTTFLPSSTPLTVSIVPAPDALGLLGAAGLIGLRRRR